MFLKIRLISEDYIQFGDYNEMCVFIFIVYYYKNCFKISDDYYYTFNFIFTCARIECCGCMIVRLV